jgi:hypothetical protein
MKSDFAMARRHLERAYNALSGDDETSRKSRDALDLLVDAILTAEYRRQECEIIPFPADEDRRSRRSNI